MPTLKQKVVSGAIWTLLEKLSCQIVGFVVGMILARLLTPNDYGTVALTSIFFAVAGTLVVRRGERLYAVEAASSRFVLCECKVFSFHFGTRKSPPKCGIINDEN